MLEDAYPSAINLTRIQSGRGCLAKVVASTRTCVMVASAMTSSPRVTAKSVARDVAETTSSSSKELGLRNPSERRIRFEPLISQRADATTEVKFEVTTRLQALPEQRCDARLDHI